MHQKLAGIWSWTLVILRQPFLNRIKQVEWNDGLMLALKDLFPPVEHADIDLVPENAVGNGRIFQLRI